MMKRYRKHEMELKTFIFKNDHCKWKIHELVEKCEVYCLADLVRVETEGVSSQTKEKQFDVIQKSI